MQKIAFGKHLLLIDDQDVHLFKIYKFFVHSRGYITGYKIGRRADGYELLHRLIAKPGIGLIVDHADGNKMNNTRANLRVCTFSQNNANKRTRSPGRRGIRKKKNRWYARIKEKGIEKYLGCYKSKDEAIEAYNRAAVSIFKDFAIIN